VISPIRQPVKWVNVIWSMAFVHCSTRLSGPAPHALRGSAIQLGKQDVSTSSRERKILNDTWLSVSVGGGDGKSHPVLLLEGELRATSSRWQILGIHCPAPILLPVADMTTLSLPSSL
jgi:hypothetical protein